MTHIVICGFPRSGTSLLYNMLCSTVEGFGFDCYEQRSAKTIRLYENHASKMPLDIFSVDWILRNNIHGKRVVFLIMLRDIRDVVVSIHANVPDRYFIGYEGGYKPDGQYPDYQITFTHPGLGEIFREVLRLRDSRPDSVLFVRYEELARNPERVQQLLGERLGLTFAAAFAEFHERPSRLGIRYEGGVAAIEPLLVRCKDEVTTGRIGLWRKPEHRERIISQFRSYPGLFQILREFGYETSDAWFEQFLHARESSTRDEKGDRLSTGQG